MKVLLATSPHVRHAAVLQNDFKPIGDVVYGFAPLGLLSLAAAVRNSAVDANCQIYDLNRRIKLGLIPLGPQFYDTVADDICAEAPDVVGFMTECDSYHHVLQICVALKKRAGHCIIVLGGPHASAVALPTMERVGAIDAVVIGEGEVSFPQLLLALNSDAAVAGTLRRVAGSRLLLGAPRALIKSLDDLPIPLFELYTPEAGEEMFIEVGRGCPFQCEFCSTAPFWQRRHRVKSPDRILQEIRRLKTLHGVDRVHFTHDLFSANRKWVKRLCYQLIKANTKVAWTCSARTDTVDEALLELMRDAGCCSIYFGLESGSQRLLREIKKDIPVSHSIEIIKTCKRLGIAANAGLIVGLPTEDQTSLRETFGLYEELLRQGCRPAHLFAFCPFTDAPMHRGLEDLKCSGHFVDLPLGADADERNRSIIASDQSLYGAYFRPDHGDLIPGQPLALAALDEFSSLVDAAIVPALALARLRDGLINVFVDWLRWVQAFNRCRNASSYRNGYASAANFAQFLTDELSKAPGASPSTKEIARAVAANLRVAENLHCGAPTSMASHRLFPLPDFDSAGLALSSRLARGAVVQTLALAFDVSPVLAGSIDDDVAEDPTYLVWHTVGPQSVRLIKVDRAVFEALEHVKRGSSTIAEMLLAKLDTDDASALSSVDAVVASLENAAREGLFTVERV